MNKAVQVILLIFLASNAYAETTGIGKIIFTQGHISSTCRTIAHKETSTGVERFFRIAEVAGDDDISAVVLSALMGNRNTTITYSPGVTTGCGTEPRITYITVY